MRIVAISSMGEMTFQDFRMECGQEAWAPLIVYRYRGQDTVRIPFFLDVDTCKVWCKRNLSRDWGISGCCFLTEEDVHSIMETSMIFEEFNWPRKIRDRVEFDVRPFELHSQPDVYGVR